MKETVWKAAAVVGAAALGAAAGCNIVAPAYYLVHGPEKAPRVYELDKARSTVFFIDDRANRIPRRATRLIVAQEAENTLMKAKVVKDVISAESAMQAAGHDRYEKPIPIAEIGRAVNADVVIYATVDQFGLSPDGTTFAPGANLRVKIVDTKTDARIWPDDPRGYPLAVRAQSKTDLLPESTAQRYKAEDELARQVGRELACLFFSHELTHGTTVPE
jgi:hypothetical protein